MKSAGQPLASTPSDDRSSKANRTPLRVLTFTTLYPNRVTPHHGVFVEQRLRNLLASQEVTSRVIAPVPWFPIKKQAFGAYAKFATVPAREVRHGISVLHPRYPVIPKIGMSAAPLLLATATYHSMQQYSADEQGFDVIDSHYFYPDGVAAALLGKWLSKPVTITARGTDVNLIPKYRIARKWIQWAARNCTKIITVSESLRNCLINLGVGASEICTLRNGVDLNLFRPIADRSSLRRKLELTGPTMLSVGHLVERKGHHLVIEALASLPDVQLMIVGDGGMRHGLRELARKHKVDHRVTFKGSVPHEELVEFYNAADALVLASSREGMANVLLESIACGTPVIASPYWGNPEIVTDSRSGVLMNDRTPSAIAMAARKLFNAPPERGAVRRYAELFSWEATTRGQVAIFHDAARNKI